MAEFVLNEDTIELPDTWDDITFEKFNGFAKLIGAFKDREEVKDDNEVKEWENTLLDLQDNTKILCYWCGLDEDKISMLDIEQANSLLKHLEFLNETYTPITIASFTINNEQFFLPQEFMKKSSFGRYIEAEQLELQSKILKKGNLDILPRQVAILCKKEGETEKIDDDIINQRAKMFEKLDMATIWDVGFFLNKLEQRLITNFLISQRMEEIQKQEQQPKQQ